MATTKGQTAAKQKGVLVDVVWTIDISAFSTRTIPGKEVLNSPRFNAVGVNASSPPTRWYLQLRLDAGEDVGLFLCADSDQMKEVEHRAVFSMGAVGKKCNNNCDRLTLSDCDTEHPHLFAPDARWQGWGWEKMTTRTRLFTQHVRKTTITINASVIVSCSVQSAEDRARELHGQKMLKVFREGQQEMGSFVISCEDKEMVAWKELVIAGSPVLAAMLDTDWKEASENKVVIGDFSYEVVRDMLKFLSTGEVTKDTDAAQLLLAADKYQIAILKQVCIDRLMKALGVDNVCECYWVADLCQVRGLKDAAGELICTHYKKVEKSPGWKKFIEESADLMTELLAMRTQKLTLLDAGKKKK